VIIGVAIQRKTVFIFTLAFALAAALTALTFQETVQERLGEAFYITGLAIIGCILLVLAGYVWDRALFQRLREISDRARVVANDSTRDVENTSHDEVITLARQIERMALSLKKTEASYRAMVEQQDDLICRYDYQGKLLFVNEAYARFFGRTKQDLLGTNFPPHFAAYPNSGDISEEERCSFELEMEGESGRHTIFHWSRHAITTELDGPVEYQAVGRDITSRKETEAGLLKAKLAAESANRSKGEFLAVVSHELRTPINGSLGFARLLQGSPLTPQQQEHVEMIVSANRMMERLISDLLDLSKLESGRIQIDRERFSVRDCVENVIAFFTPKASSSGLTLSYSIAANVPEVITSDPNRLRQILINLVGNALKFTERGSVTLVVSRVDETRELRDMGLPLKLNFSVVDTGIGIPSEKIPRLFLPFSQVDSSARRRGGGTGLGLVISKRLCEIMGGAITVQSRPGEGSTFSFTLKAEAADATPEKSDVPFQLETSTA